MVIQCRFEAVKSVARLFHRSFSLGMFSMKPKMWSKLRMLGSLGQTKERFRKIELKNKHQQTHLALLNQMASKFFS